MATPVTMEGRKTRSDIAVHQQIIVIKQLLISEVMIKWVLRCVSMSEFYVNVFLELQMRILLVLRSPGVGVDIVVFF
jgi:hypothetical protein